MSESRPTPPGDRPDGGPDGGPVDGPVDGAADSSGGATNGDTKSPDKAPAPPGTGKPAPKPEDPLRASRTSGLWFGVVLLAGLLVLLAVFILQNTQSVTIAFFGFEGEAPLAAAILIASAAGALLVVVAGSLRILQLRRRVRRERKRAA